MDSANSGSFSSSAGDEEYDSSAFFTSVTTATTATTALSPAPPTPTHHPHPHHFFSPLPFFDNPNPNPWSPTFLPSPPSNPSFTTNPPPPQQPPPPADQSTIPSAAAAAPRSSKKRSRASRRAPTTVLTTDTTNFRAMVQEFTGIPTSPFAASFPRSRFDGAAPPSYLLRPFALKPQAPPSSTSNPNSYENMLNMAPQMPSFQSLLQSQLNPKYIPTMVPAEASYGVNVELGMPSTGGRRDQLTGWANASGPVQGGGDRTQLRPIGRSARQGEAMESWMLSSD